MLPSEIRNVLPFMRDHLFVLLKGMYRRSYPALPYAFSFNISDRCPAGCNCYWRAQARVAELTDDEVVSFFEKKRTEGYVHANIVGGEPYVRSNLLTKIAGIIPFNWVITSATTPLRKLRNTTHIISIDGSNRRTHDRIRGMQGLYARILRNLANVRSDQDFRVIIHTTLNAHNYQELEEILEIWSSNGLADGIMISTITPIMSAGDDQFRLTREQRIWIVNEPTRFRPKYAGFLCMTEAMIRRLHPDHTQQLHPGICDTARWIESYDAAGRRIPQCILSEKADCGQCGCVVTTMLDGTRSSNLGSMIETARTMSKTLTLR